MKPDDLMKNAGLGRIASQGALIYEKLRETFEPDHHGEFLAIDIDTKDAYLASTSAEAMVKARSAHPNKIFYVKKIGFDAAETMANLILNK
jgi:hypothetical protein